MKNRIVLIGLGLVLVASIAGNVYLFTSIQGVSTNNEGLTAEIEGLTAQVEIANAENAALAMRTEEVHGSIAEVEAAIADIVADIYVVTPGRPNLADYDTYKDFFDAYIEWYNSWSDTPYDVPNKDE